LWAGTARGTVVDVLIIGAPQGKPRSWMKKNRVRSVQSPNFSAQFAICRVLVLCAELSVIRVVAAMSIQKIARDPTSKASKKWQIHISRRSRRHET
jgi:hypothetical protein